MGGKISLIVGVISILLFYEMDYISLFWISVAITIVAFWSYGVMHNFAFDSAKDRRKRRIENKKELDLEINSIEELPIKIGKSDVNVVPNWLTLLNMIFSIALYLLLFIALFKFFS